MPTNIALGMTAALSVRHFLIIVIWILKERNGPNGLVPVKFYLFFATLWLHSLLKTYFRAVFRQDHAIKHDVLFKDIRKQTAIGRAIFQNKTLNLSDLTSRHHNRVRSPNSEANDSLFQLSREHRFLLVFDAG
jgi:hypothetical protein